LITRLFSVDNVVENEGITQNVGGELYSREFLRRYLPACDCDAYSLELSTASGATKEIRSRVVRVCRLVRICRLVRV
jgi:hypothetical protein